MGFGIIFSLTGGFISPPIAALDAKTNFLTLFILHPSRILRVPAKLILKSKIGFLRDFVIFVFAAK